MAKFRKKPVVIDAVLWDGKNANEVLNFCNTDKKTMAVYYFNHDEFLIETLEGTMTAKVGDWIVRGVNEELYPCKPDIFSKTYEAV